MLQSMALDEASVEALKILKQVMEEKLTSTNIEASLCVSFMLQLHFSS